MKKVKKTKSKKKKFDKKSLAEFKKILLARKEAITDEIKHISSDTLKQSQKEASGDISGYSYHMADVATDNYDREFSLGLASNEREFLYEIDAALVKMKEGSFGICEGCGCNITKTRLKAVPQAKMCIKCKEAEENKR
ncbi:TraR/DksA family transcriptional regulator [Thermoproteota archaeon]